MIIAYSNTIFYILCPANLSTGGPTLLHQLAIKLKKKGISAKMYYVNVSKEDPVHIDYKKYNIEYVTKIHDENHHVLVIPEAFTHFYFNYKKIRKVFWWLSVNNYTDQFVGRRRKIKNLLNYFNTYRVNRDENESNIHLAQSYYALDFLKRNNRKKTFLLSDFLDENFMVKGREIFLDKKTNKILYNPKKGYEFTEKIMKYLPDFEWIPIKDMSPSEVSDLLAISKVYIDFGTHPGKDRFPREAAICKCCVITGRNGAANFFEDVPIKDEYKFDESESSVPLIANKIRWCIENFENALNDFDSYRITIENEENVFDSQLNKLVILK